MTFQVDDKVRLTKGTLFVGVGGEGTIVEPALGQAPPQLFPWRVAFKMGQDTRTVWCATNELELVEELHSSSDVQPEVARLVEVKAPPGPFFKAGDHVVSVFGKYFGEVVGVAKSPLPYHVIWDDSVGNGYYKASELRPYDRGLEADNQVADGSRDYCPEGGPEDGDPADTAPGTEAPICPCGNGEPCPTMAPPGIDDDPWDDDWAWDPTKSGLYSDFELDVARIFNEAEALLHKKHKDYGPKNISQSPGGALNGLRVRMHDKLARLSHLVDNGQEPQVLDEKLTDTLRDLMNYSAIALMVLEGTWPVS